MPKILSKSSSEKYAYSPRIPFLCELTSIFGPARRRSKPSPVTTSKRRAVPKRDVSLALLIRVAGETEVVANVSDIRVPSDLDSSHNSQVIPPSSNKSDTTILDECEVPEGEGGEDQEAEEDGDEDEGHEEQHRRMGKYLPYY